MEEKENKVASKIKRVREGLNLSVTDVAKRLKVSEENVSFFETDKMNPATLTTFQRGYLRNYFKILKLSESEFPEYFTASSEICSELFPVEKKFYKQAFITKRKGNIILFTFILVIAVVVFASLY